MKQRHLGDVWISSYNQRKCLKLNNLPNIPNQILYFKIISVSLTTICLDMSCQISIFVAIFRGHCVVSLQSINTYLWPQAGWSTIHNERLRAATNTWKVLEYSVSYSKYSNFVYSLNIFRRQKACVNFSYELVILYTTDPYNNKLTGRNNVVVIMLD